jgi:hypothetical protein
MEKKTAYVEKDVGDRKIKEIFWVLPVFDWVDNDRREGG